jgi:hypothetical protein
MILDLELPAALHGELIEAAKEARCNPEVFAGECVESVLATRRLPRVQPGAHGPRIATREIEEVEPLAYSVRLESYCDGHGSR